MPYLGSSFREGTEFIVSAVVFHMLSQEGGVNIYAVIWNIMLFCMLLPFAYVWLRTLMILPPAAAVLAQDNMSCSGCACACVAKMLRVLARCCVLFSGVFS